jgi:hypothetical protein
MATHAFRAAPIWSLPRVRLRLLRWIDAYMLAAADARAAMRAAHTRLPFTDW